MPVVGYVLPEHAGAGRRPAGKVDRRPAPDPRVALQPLPLPRQEIRVRRREPPGVNGQPMSSGRLAPGESSRCLARLWVRGLPHMWSADVVTMQTRDDIWLNEGSATYRRPSIASDRGAVPGPLLAPRYDDGRYAGQPGPAWSSLPASDPFRHTGASTRRGDGSSTCSAGRSATRCFFAGLREYGRRHVRGNATRADSGRSSRRSGPGPPPVLRPVGRDALPAHPAGLLAQRRRREGGGDGPADPGAHRRPPGHGGGRHAPSTASRSSSASSPPPRPRRRRSSSGDEAAGDVHPRGSRRCSRRLAGRSPDGDLLKIVEAIGQGS